MSSADYAFMRVGGEGIVVCDCCGSEAPLQCFETPLVSFETPNTELFVNRKYDLLCEICSSTFIANTYIYNHLRDKNFQATALAACTNMIRKDLGAFKNVKIIDITDDQLSGYKIVKTD